MTFKPCLMFAFFLAAKDTHSAQNTAQPPIRSVSVLKNDQWRRFIDTNDDSVEFLEDLNLAPIAVRIEGNVNGKEFWLTKEMYTYEEARAKCDSMETWLAEPRTKEENDHIKRFLLQKGFHSKRDVWFGASVQNSFGSPAFCYWSDRFPVFKPGSFKDWPKKQQINLKNVRKCLGWKASTGYMWDQFQCVAKLHAVCVNNHKVCQQPLGIEYGRVEDSQMTSQYPTRYGAKSGAHRARLNAVEGNETGAWEPLDYDPLDALSVDLGKPFYISAIITQGRDKSSEWTKDFRIIYERVPGGRVFVLDRLTEENYFMGNNDSSTPVKHNFRQIAKAQKLSIYPLQWNNWVAMRIEFLGC